MNGDIDMHELKRKHDGSLPRKRRRRPPDLKSLGEFDPLDVDYDTSTLPSLNQMHYYNDEYEENIDQKSRSKKSPLSGQPTAPRKQAKTPQKSAKLLETLALRQKNVERPKRRTLPETAYFDDGLRQIDMVLVYKPVSESTRNKASVRAFRKKFEQEMRNIGLELEVAQASGCKSNELCYIKVYATFEALKRQAEFEKLSMPVQLADCVFKPTGMARQILGRLNPFEMPQHLKLKHPNYFTDIFRRDHEDEFLFCNPETFFTSAQRIMLTWSIMKSIQINVTLNSSKKNEWLNLDLFDVEANKDKKLDDKKVVKTANIKYLLNRGVYSNCFPLHDASIPKKSITKSSRFDKCFNFLKKRKSPVKPTTKEKDDDSDEVKYSKMPIEQWPQRVYLYEVWARWGMWTAYQPLDDIRDYYGEKVGLYFAWLGFYTKMLIFPSIVGIIVLIAGICLAYGTDDHVTSYFCSEDRFDILGTQTNTTLARYPTFGYQIKKLDRAVYFDEDVVFCRTCPAKHCPFTNAADLCKTARLSRAFDNLGNTIFSLFMSVWAMMFLEYWKRTQNELCVRWDMNEKKVNDESIRPEYTIQVQTYRVNPVTLQKEPFLGKRSFYARLLASLGTVLFFIMVVLALLIVIMSYKSVGPSVWQQIYYLRYFPDYIDPTLMTSITSSLMNGLSIAIMTKVYDLVAWRLTNLEMHRTEAAHETSYTYKIVVFQFVNYYGALFYLAFVRGQATPNPIEQTPFDFTPKSSCPPTGCMLDVTIQLFIIMTGKQVFNNVMELGVPVLMNIIKRRGQTMKKFRRRPRWECDMGLVDNSRIQLHSDYLEMLIQYGFVTMFVPSFPLAPLFALLNNILEIRVDAYKMLTTAKRPIPARSKDIGPWYDLLSMVSMSKLAVVTNALLIALTSSFIDIVVFELVYSHQSLNIHNGEDVNGSIYRDNFMQFATTPFNTSHWCLMPGADDRCVELLYLNQEFTFSDKFDLAHMIHEVYQNDFGDLNARLENRFLETDMFEDYADFLVKIEAALNTELHIHGRENRTFTAVSETQLNFINHLMDSMDHVYVENPSIAKDPNLTKFAYEVREFLNVSYTYVLDAYHNNRTYEDGWPVDLTLGATHNHFVPTCYFRSYRFDNPELGWIMNSEWYHIVMAEVCFILIFENIVWVVQGFLCWLIDDEPEHVVVHTKRENYLQHEWFKMRELGEFYNDPHDNDVMNVDIDENDDYLVALEEMALQKHSAHARSKSSLHKYEQNGDVKKESVRHGNGVVKNGTNAVISINNGATGKDRKRRNAGKLSSKKKPASGLLGRFFKR